MSQGIKVVIAASASPTERAAADLLARRINARTGSPATVEEGNREQADVLVGTPGNSKEIRSLIDGGSLQGLGPEGFILSTAKDGTTVVAGNTEAAVVFAVGRLLRDSRFEPGRWIRPRDEVRDRPAMPVRTIYFADHMGNWYSHAPPEEVIEYLEEMALWGYNELMTCLAVRPGETFYEAIARLHELEDHARLLGMRAGTVVQSNTSFDKPRDEWKATPGPIPGAYDVCPSREGAWQFLVEDKRVYLAPMQPYEFICLWPYDGGGCYCARCAPWAKTFLELSSDIAAYSIGDASEVRVSAWFFERDVAGEDDALFAYLERKPDWFRYIVAGAAEARRWVEADRAVPDPYRVLLFPDISMFDGIPWGGRGANPAPHRFARELTDTRDMLAGGIVYSEGRYDDLNKILWARMLWDPDLDPAAIVGEYCREYFGEQVASEATDLVLTIERDMKLLPDPERWRRGIFHEEWDPRAESIEAQLPPETRVSWRWQLIRAKTKIEAAYSALRGEAGSANGEAFDVLRETYDHLQAHLNRHDPARSLPTWIYAPVEEAFPASSS